MSSSIPAGNCGCLSQMQHADKSVRGLELDVYVDADDVALVAGDDDVIDCFGLMSGGGGGEGVGAGALAGANVVAGGRGLHGFLVGAVGQGERGVIDGRAGCPVGHGGGETVDVEEGAGDGAGVAGGAEEGEGCQGGEDGSHVLAYWGSSWRGVTRMISDSRREFALICW
jgi:hypothetical protein